MHPDLGYWLSNQRLREIHASAARGRLVARHYPTRVDAGSDLVRRLTAALAAVALVLGLR